MGRASTMGLALPCVALLCAVLMCATAPARALHVGRHGHHAAHVRRADVLAGAHGRRLLETVGTCVWLDDECSVNPLYLSAAPNPTTDVGKYQAALLSVSIKCDGYDASACNTAPGNETCKWDGNGKYCYPTLSGEWNADRRFRMCKGSRMDQILQCGEHTNSDNENSNAAACNADSTCTWNSLEGSAYAGAFWSIDVTRGAISMLGSDPNALEDSNPYKALGKVCAPKWTTDNGAINEITAGLNKITSANGKEYYTALQFLKELVGDCDQIKPTKDTAKSCFDQTTMDACEAQNPDTTTEKCVWMGAANVPDTYAAECIAGGDLVSYMMDHTNDPAVQAFETQDKACGTYTTSAACTGAGTFSVDQSKVDNYYNDYKKQVTGDGAAGTIRAPLLLPLLLALAALLLVNRL